jgi:hypothetical protein
MKVYIFSRVGSSSLSKAKLDWTVRSVSCSRYRRESVSLSKSRSGLQKISKSSTKTFTFLKSRSSSKKLNIFQIPSKRI